MDVSGRCQKCGLRWCDIKFHQNTILLKSGHSKNLRQRSIPLPVELRDSLLLLFANSQKVTPNIGTHVQAFNVKLFNDRYKADQLLEDHVSRFFRKLHNLTGLRISAHRLCHICGTEIMKAQLKSNVADPVSLKTLQNLLGHRSITTTAMYLHPSIDDMNKMLQKLPTI